VTNSVTNLGALKHKTTVDVKENEEIKSFPRETSSNKPFEAIKKSIEREDVKKEGN
jgi:hypothetical protein